MSALAPASIISTSTLSHALVERFFRDRAGVWRQIGAEDGLNQLIVQMLGNSIGAFACYGAILGFSHSFAQAASSAIKLPLLFLLTLAICLPTLYLAQLLLGGRLSARQVIAVTLAAITVTGFCTLAFTPITLFFLIIAQSYQFYLLLNVLILTMTSVVGLHFLIDGVRRLNTHPVSLLEDEGEDHSPSPVLKARRPHRAQLGLLYVWLSLYAFVGTQLGWTLRPFFGSPGLPFQLFRHVEGSFYESLFHLIAHVMF